MFTQAIIAALFFSPVSGKHVHKESHNRDALDFYGGAENIPTRGKGAPKVREDFGMLR